MKIQTVPRTKMPRPTNAARHNRTPFSAETTILLIVVSVFLSTSPTGNVPDRQRPRSATSPIGNGTDRLLLSFRQIDMHAERANAVRNRAVLYRDRFVGR